MAAIQAGVLLAFRECREWLRVATILLLRFISAWLSLFYAETKAPECKSGLKGEAESADQAIVHVCLNAIEIIVNSFAGREKQTPSVG